VLTGLGGKAYDKVGHDYDHHNNLVSAVLDMYPESWAHVWLEAETDTWGNKE
jgi:hypothetical protein